MTRLASSVASINPSFGRALRQASKRFRHAAQGGVRSTWAWQGHAWAAIIVAVRDVADRGEGVALLGVLRLGRAPLIPDGAARGVLCASGPSTFRTLGSHDSGVAGVSHRGPAIRL